MARLPLKQFLADNPKKFLFLTVVKEQNWKTEVLNCKSRVVYYSIISESFCVCRVMLTEKLSKKCSTIS
ncbi:ASN_HP2_G0050640.mRNA.1.CDS.1 [Saccharomyces cerevisiae]|nr:ASN_HP2_G0050640.mRNA.1.CDS.1 [Saccharomyces cerevisiae]CAI6708317.1 ASN_HP2_G0050640.mRNA.1.CDS.1 [Saccharomyces cerevisiae]